MRSADAIVTLEELGSFQWGLVTTAQAEAYGVSRVTVGRLRDDEVLDPVRRGVWALPSSSHGALQDLRAAWLATDTKRLAPERVAAGSDVAVSHVSALAVHELGDLIPRQHEFTSPKRRQTVHEDLKFHRAALEGDIDIVEGLPVLSIPRTVRDVAAAGMDFDHLATIIRDALGAVGVTRSEISSRLNPIAPKYRFADGEALIEACLEKAGRPRVVDNFTSPAAQLQQVLAQGALASLMPKMDMAAFSPEMQRVMRSISSSALANLVQSQHSQLSSTDVAQAFRALIGNPSVSHLPLAFPELRGTLRASQHSHPNSGEDSRDEGDACPEGEDEEA